MYVSRSHLWCLVDRRRSTEVSKIQYSCVDLAQFMLSSASHWIDEQSTSERELATTIMTLRWMDEPVANKYD